MLLSWNYLISSLDDQSSLTAARLRHLYLGNSGYPKAEDDPDDT